MPTNRPDNQQVVPDLPFAGPGGAPALSAQPSPRDPEALVKQFHRVYDLPIDYETVSVNRSRVHMRMSLIGEEYAELVGAIYGPKARQAVERLQASFVSELDEGTRDTVEAADALADLIYVIYGMALECGINLPSVLEQVQASNMSKLGADGLPIYRADGKVLKGPDFFVPDVDAALNQPISRQ